MQTLLAIFVILTSIFIILLVLIQKGKGGGLAGAFGGMGGQSAFGTKAGDVFTKITVVTVAFWFVLSIVTIFVLKNQAGRPSLDIEGGATGATQQSSTSEGAGTTPAP